MIFKPLSLSPEMMRAYLDGRKTMTRRLVKPQPIYAKNPQTGLEEWEWTKPGLKSPIYIYQERPVRSILAKSAPIQPGEFIWWRECLNQDAAEAVYTADGNKSGLAWRRKNTVLPSIFMPKWACRAVAELLEVRAERVQEMGGRWDWFWVYRFRPLKGDELKVALEVLNDRS